MGNFSSSSNNNNNSNNPASLRGNMSDSDSSTDSDGSELLRNESNDYLSEHYLVLILRQLIDSGDVDMLSTEDLKLPIIKKKPNLEKLKVRYGFITQFLVFYSIPFSVFQKNFIFNTVKQASGFGALSDKDPHSRWSILNMIANRQNGIGLKDGPFTQFDRSKINNLFIPNRKNRTICRAKTKVFSGVFSPDGTRFLTASQDHNIRVFDSSSTKYKLIKTINANCVNWSILDLDVSKDGQHFAYSSWRSCSKFSI